MYRVDKFYGPERQVLSNVSLSFLPGAKIGVLGPNGAGKSTVLRIMAGVEEPSSGEAQLARGATVGLLSQEPDLDPEKTVRENVEDGVREARDLLDRFNTISAQFAEPDADYDTLLAEQAKVQDEIDRRDLWELDATLDRAMDALRTPDGDRDVVYALGRRAPPRRARAAAALRARPPAARRADEPPRRRVGLVARALPRRLQGHGRRGHARPVLPRQRRRLDPRARPRQGAPLRGQLLVLARAEAGAARDRGEAGVGAAAHARARARVGSREPARAAREVEGAPRRVREAARRGAEREARQGRDPHPAGPAARRRRDRGRRRLEGLRRPAAVRGPDVLAAARRDRRRDRPERRGQDDALPDDRRRGAARTPARSASATPCSSPTSTSRASRSTRRATVWKEISGGLDTIELGKRELNSRQYVSLVQLQGRRPAEARRRPLRRRAEPRAPREAAALGRERADARRADERPRRRHAARARGGAPRLRRLRGGDLARSLVPRPDRDAHPRTSTATPR